MSVAEQAPAAVDLGEAGTVTLVPLEELEGMVRANHEEIRRHEEAAKAADSAADEQYVQAGALLASRRGEWRSGELDAEVIEIDRLQASIRRIDQALAAAQNAPHRGLSGFLRWFTEESDVERLHAERSPLEEQLRSALLKLGRAAPQVTIPDGDRFLAAARMEASKSESEKANATRIRAALVGAELELKRRQEAAQKMGFDVLYQAAYFGEVRADAGPRVAADSEVRRSRVPRCSDDARSNRE